MAEKVWRGERTAVVLSDEWYAFGPPAFQTEMRERIGKGERLWE